MGKDVVKLSSTSKLLEVDIIDGKRGELRSRWIVSNRLPLATTLNKNWNQAPVAWLLQFEGLLVEKTLWVGAVPEKFPCQRLNLLRTQKAKYDGPKISNEL